MMAAVDRFMQRNRQIASDIDLGSAVAGCRKFPCTL
jgi:hypothetical protein